MTRLRDHLFVMDTQQTLQRTAIGIPGIDAPILLLNQ